MAKVDRIETHRCYTFTFEEIATALGLKGRIVYLQAELHENPLRFKGNAQIHVVDTAERCKVCGAEGEEPCDSSRHYVATVGR